MRRPTRSLARCLLAASGAVPATALAAGADPVRERQLILSHGRKLG